MLGNYFTIDGVSSREYGLFCKQLPMFPVAVQGYNTITVGGRPENLFQASGHSNDIQFDIEAVLVGFAMDDIIQWLQSGKRLELSNQPDRYAVIKQLVAIEQKRAGNGALELKFTLKCGPFKYRIAEPEHWTNSPVYFQTIGNIYSEPLIVAKGCSDGATIAVNGKPLITSGLTGDIYIDVPNRVIYQLVEGVKTVVQEHTSGDFWDFLLVPSETEYNSLVFSGVTTIDLYKNERWC